MATEIKAQEWGWIEWASRRNVLKAQPFIRRRYISEYQVRSYAVYLMNRAALLTGVPVGHIQCVNTLFEEKVNALFAGKRRIKFRRLKEIQQELLLPLPPRNSQLE